MVKSSNKPIGEQQPLKPSINVVDEVFTGYEPWRWHRPAKTFKPSKESTEPNPRIDPATSQKLLRQSRPDPSLASNPPGVISVKNQHPPGCEESGEKVDQSTNKKQGSPLGSATDNHELDCTNHLSSDFAGQLLVRLSLLRDQNQPRWKRLLWAGVALLLWAIVGVALMTISQLLHL